ncbi:hypothetical protein ACMHYJ_09940 [Castellaniella hirudinis]|uniref:hypothetical protein n=1 Tax=Castellaniella hirudinis TaxID=1144617 RepID=UPI0039C2C11E
MNKKTNRKNNFQLNIKINEERKKFIVDYAKKHKVDIRKLIIDFIDELRDGKIVEKSVVEIEAKQLNTEPKKDILDMSDIFGG